MRSSAIGAIITANVIFGLNTPITKAIIANWMTPLGYTMLRMFFGAIVFWFIGIFTPNEKIEKRDLALIFIGGLLGYLGTQFLFSQSLKYTSPVDFSLIMALIPVVVIVLSFIFLKENFNFKKVLGLILSVAGAAIIILSNKNSSEPGSNDMLGIFFAFLCVLAYATYMVLTRKISQKYQPLTIAKWMFLFSSICLLPFIPSGFSEQNLYTASLNLHPILLLAFSLIFSTIIAFFLMPYALKNLEAGTVSLFMNIQPIVASAVAIAVGQDNISFIMVLAAILVITGAYFASQNNLKISN